MPSQQEVWAKKVSLLRTKLAVDQSTVLRSAVANFVNAMCLENSKGISAAPTGFQELQNLCLIHPSSIVVESALYGIEKIVDKNILPVDSGLNCFIQHFASFPSSCLGLVLSLIFKFVRLPTSEYSTEIIISLCQQRSEVIEELFVLCDVLREDSSLLRREDWKHELEPIFNFIFQSKGVSNVFKHRNTLLSFLSRQIEYLSLSEDSTEKGWEIVCYVAQNIDYITLVTAENLLFHLELCQQLLSHCERFYTASFLTSDDYIECGQQLMTHLLSLWGEIHSNSLRASTVKKEEPNTRSNIIKNMSGIIFLVYKPREVGLVISTIKQICFRLSSKNLLEQLKGPSHLKNIIMLGYLLLDSIEYHQQDILWLLNHFLIPSLAVDPFCRLFVLSRLIYPLLQIMSSAEGQTKALASQILFRIEKFLAVSPNSSVKVENNKKVDIKKSLPSMVLSGTSVKLYYLIDLSIDFYTSSMSVKGKSLATCIQDNIKIITKLLEKESIGPFLTYWLAPFLFNSSACVRSQTCSLFQKMIELNSEYSIGLFPLLVYQSEAESNGKVQMEILRTLPALASHSQMLHPIYAFLSPLLEQEDIKAMAIRLLRELWSAQDKCFRTLESTLLTAYNDKETLTIDVHRAIAITIRDICKERPTRGMEFISVISSLIKSSHLPLVKSWGIQALTHLCIADCVDFSTAWEIIGDDVEGDKHPLLLEQQIRLFESGLHEGIDIEDEFSQFQLKKLWEGSQSEEEMVRTASYEMLTLFFYKLTSCISFNSTTEDHMRVVMDSSHKTYESSLEVTRAILKEEIGSTRKQIEVQAQGNPLYDSLFKMRQFVEDTYVEGMHPGRNSGLAGGNMWSFFRIPSKKSTVQGRVLGLARAHQIRFDDILHDVVSNNWLNKIISLFGWIRFGASYLTALIDAERVKREKEDPEKKKEYQDEYVVSINILLGRLQENREESPAIAENCALALAGFTMALPPSKHEIIEQCIEYMESLVAEKANEREMFGSLISLACMTHALPLSNHILLEHIYHILCEVEATAETEWIRFAIFWANGILAAGLLQKQKNHLKSKTANKTSMIIDAISKKLFLVVKQAQGTETKNVSLLGASIGLSYIYGAQSDTKKISSSLQEVESMIEAEKENSKRMSTTSICFIYGALVLRGYRLHIISNDKLENQMNKFMEMAFPVNTADGNLGAIISLGSLLQGASLYGFHVKRELFDSVLSSLHSLASYSFVSDSLREAALLGLCNLLGANVILHVDGCVPFTSSGNYLSAAFVHMVETTTAAWSSKIVQSLTSMFHNPEVSSRVGTMCAWCMGLLSRPLPSHIVAPSTSALLCQLPEDSLLRAMLQHLHDSAPSLQRNHPQYEALALQMTKILVACCDIPNRKLPSINWTPILQQLIHSEQEMDVRAAAFRFAIHNSANASVAHLLTCSLEIGDFIHLPLSIRLSLVGAIPKLLDSFATNRSIQLIKEHSQLVCDSIEVEGIALSSETCCMTKEWSKALLSMLSKRSLSTSLRTVAELAFHSLLSILPLPIIPSTEVGSRFPYSKKKEISDLFSFVAERMKSFTNDLIFHFLSLDSVVEYSELNMKKFILICLLVQNGCLPTLHLLPLPSFCFNHPDLSFSSVLLTWMVYALGGVPRAVQRSWYQDCVDCLTVMRSPLVVIRFLSWISLLWCSSDLKCLLSMNTGVVDVLHQNNNDFLTFTIERLLPYALPSLLIQFDTTFPTDDIIPTQIASLVQKNMKLSNPHEEGSQLAQSLLRHTIKLLQQQTGK